MGGKDEDKKDADARSGKEWFDSWQAQHDQLLSELENESKRLQKDLPRDSSSAAGPFSAFKRFIDDGFSSLSSALQNLPSSTAELESRMQRVQEQWRAEEQDISQRWTGSTDSPDHIQMEISRTSDREKMQVRNSTLELLDTARERNAHVPPAKIEALYRDSGADNGGMRDFLAEVSGGTWGPPRWLSVAWFKRDPYSPVRLEGHHALGEYGAKWRAAFEDLLDASLDKPMGSIERVGMREPFGKLPQSTYYGPGLDWMLSLQCRGILPMQLPRTYSVPRMARELGGMCLADHALETGNPFLLDDLRDLLSAVGTKAVPETGAEPLPVRVHPETEQDLYESEHLFPGVSPSNSAPRPDSSDAELAQSRNTEQSQDKNFRDALLRRGYELAGDEFEDFASTMPEIEKLLERVLRLQQEWDSIEESTGAGKASLKGALEDPRPAAVAQERRKELVSNHEQQRTDPHRKRPDVLSSLTTTHTTRLPDGTVNTRVVLKQRFVDGREETTESMHTRNEAASQSQQGRSSEEIKPEKRGWFWS
ncbi:hypothetical protein CERZMDRAFT_102691 [Cercospora zeae-maydis SCOH1-5]|uniref:Uncharacterized protein n=1 Tax=Cercospora zeae-maydis SCOH1-5 TaxID=717836 RepID=A0A6A6F0F1_9PEZI|nr:hypothetical protein CERZMDRAFT_102691 [Cercospora zeae-maydis SCOH1-5]